MSTRYVNMAKMVDPAVTVVFNDTFKDVTKTVDKIFNVQKAQNYITEMASNVNVSMAEYRSEQASISYEDFLAGNTKNITQYAYSRGVKISDKLFKWNKLGQIKSLVSAAARTITSRKEFDGTKHLERSFLTTYTHSKDGSTILNLTGGDSAALISASHSTTRTSTAQSNRIGDGTTVNMDLAEDALEAAETYTAPLLTNNSDEPIEVTYTRLFISKNKSWVAQRLLKSPGRVGTPNRDTNLVQGRYELVELPYLNSSYNAYWWLQDSALNNIDGFMSMYVGKENEKDGPYVDFDTKCIKYSWENEHGMGFNAYQSYAGSKGTNAA